MVGKRMMWMKWMLLFAVCQHSLCISQPYRLVDENTTCLKIKDKSRLSCDDKGQFYHCLLDENYTKEFEVCRVWKWIPGGKCAYFNSYGIGNIDERDCTSSSTLQCATEDYRSDLNTRYNACYVKKRIAITIPIITVSVRPTGSGTSDVRNTTETAPTESTPPESQFNCSAIGITFAVIVSLILLVVVPGFVQFKRRRQTQGPGNRRSAEDDVEMNSLDENNQNLLRTENADEVTSRATDNVTPDDVEDYTHLLPGENQIGNNGRQEMVECIKGNQSERKDNEDVDVELNGPSVTDKSLNQTVKADSNYKKKAIQTHAGEEGNSEQEDAVVDNTIRESDNRGGSSNNVTVKHVGEQEHQSNIAHTHLNSSADSGSDQDENEDTSKDIKVTEGIFVDSLQSITKEDDEEGGWSEVQDLLEYMCTGPARKILYSVVKEYGNNPDNYFQDESKKALLKSVLPTEFHSALDHESEHRHSIPVMHAILQVSLSEEHQPKSGWGQKVKDTDTGVGDDVERVYQVHTLSRGIQNQDEISVDGYVRIFEMFKGAVERLDIKGKYSEDYKKIVRRWETIQRKLWVKDKWNTFTNFIKKLS